MVDLSVYQRLVPLAQAMKQNQRENLQNQLIQANIEKAQQSATSGGSAPAAMQIANKMFELEKAYMDESLDPNQRNEALRQYNLLGQAAKTYGFDRGIMYNLPQSGQPSGGFEMPQQDVTQQVMGLPPAFEGLPQGDPMQEHEQAVMQQQEQIGASPMQRPSLTPPAISSVAGYDQIMAQRAAEKKRAETQAAKDVELQMQPMIEREKNKAQELGKAEGQITAEMRDRMATMPQLQQVANRLSALGKLATYTMTGQARDFLMRQAGMDVPDAAVARTEYISIVDNEILPLLRQTFGAQFTQKEGESLKVTLGDPNKSPQEKDAVLRSFIQTKMETINSQARRVGAQEPYSAEDIQAAVSGFQQPRSQSAPQAGAVEDGYMFMGGDPSNPSSWKKVQ